MKENMKYLTNHYQLREFTLIRMLEIINQNKNITPWRNCFYGIQLLSIVIWTSIILR
ncbi:MAG: hypothetical protein ACLRQF_18475 [Thomasclavelia ramosa]